MDRSRFARARRAVRPALDGAVVVACGLVFAFPGCIEPSYDGPRTDANVASATRDPAPVADTAHEGKPPAPDAAVAMSLTSDAMSVASELDAAAAMSATPPAWALPLLGQYAVRVRAFARGNGALGALNQLKGEWLLLGTFRFDTEHDEVHLSTKICRATGDNNLAGIVATVSPVYPETLPTHEYRVQTQNNEWSTSGDPVRYGFQSTPLVSCAGMDGQRVKGADEQRWLKDGLCLCPSTDAPPLMQDDCRINDVDHDRQPGATMMAVGALNANYYVRHLDAAEYVHGQFDAAGAAKSSGYAQNSDQRQLGCNPEPCAHDDSVPCDPSRNPVLFARLGDATGTFTCADVLRGVPTLFPADPLAFPPSGC